MEFLYKTTRTIASLKLQSIPLRPSVVFVSILISIIDSIPHALILKIRLTHKNAFVKATGLLSSYILKSFMAFYFIRAWYDNNITVCGVIGINPYAFIIL